MRRDVPFGSGVLRGLGAAPEAHNAAVTSLEHATNEQIAQTSFPATLPLAARAPYADFPQKAGPEGSFGYSENQHFCRRQIQILYVSSCCSST